MEKIQYPWSSNDGKVSWNTRGCEQHWQGTKLATGDNDDLLFFLVHTAHSCIHDV